MGPLLNKRETGGGEYSYVSASLATHLYDAGVPLRQIMEITGHASLASLTCYLNLDKRAAGNALLNFFAN